MQPRAESLAAVAAATGCTVDELLGRSDSRIEPEIRTDLQAYLDQRKAEGRPVSDERLAELASLRLIGKNPGIEWWRAQDALIDMAGIDRARAAAVIAAESEAEAKATGVRKMQRRKPRR